MNIPALRRGGAGKAVARGATAAAIAVAACGIGVLPAAAQPLGQHPSSGCGAESLVGTWQLQGTDDGNPVTPIAYFHPDHTLDFTPPDNSFDGTGNWRVNRDGKFSFDQAHYIDDASGNPVNWIKAEVTGTVTGDHLTGQGTAQLYDLSGNVQANYVVIFEGDRTSTSDRPGT